jgi:hypothetical protein
MNYAVEIGSGDMIYIPSFLNIGSGIQKLIMGDRHTDKKVIDPISLFSFFFFKIRENRLETYFCNSEA